MGIKRWTLAISIIVVVSGLLILLFLQSGADERVLESLLPRVEERLGVEISYEDVDVSLTAVSFEGVEVRPAGGGLPFALIEQMGLGVRVGPLLAGDLDLTGIRVRGLELRLGKAAGGADLSQWRRLADKVMEIGDGDALAGEDAIVRPEIQVVSGKVLMDDGRFSLSVGSFSGRITDSGGALATAEDFHVARGDGKLISGRSADLQYRSEGERLVATLDRPEFEVPTGGPQLLAMIRDVRETLGEVGLLDAMGPASGDAGAGEDGALGLSLRISVTDGTADLVGGDDGGERTSLDNVSGELSMSREGVVSVRSAGGMPGTDARWTMGAAWPIGGYPRLTLEVPDMPLASLGGLFFDSENVVWSRASADGTVTVEAAEGWNRLAFEGQASISGLEVRHGGLAAAPIDGLDLQVDFKATYDRTLAVAKLERLQISRGLARVTLRGDVHRDRLAFDLFANVPPTACRQLFGAVPEPLREDLEGVRLDGTMSLDMHLSVDEKAPEATALEVALDNRCRITDFGSVMDPDALRRPFAYTAYSADAEPMRLVSGPGTDRWTPYSMISPYLVEAALTTEDGKFRHHGGVTVPELRKAIELNMTKSALAHGASTITMQLAKNLFLTRERTVARKLEELFFTWYLETYFSKDEILELYFNVIEFGPSIYGIRDAANHYFGREPHELNLMESVFLVKLLPSPVVRHGTYVQGEVGERKLASLRKVMATMRDRGRISQAELQEGLGQTIQFHREGDPLPEPRVPVDRGGVRDPSGNEMYDDDGESELGWTDGFP